MIAIMTLTVAAFAVTVTPASATQTQSNTPKIDEIRVGNPMVLGGHGRMTTTERVGEYSLESGSGCYTANSGGQTHNNSDHRRACRGSTYTNALAGLRLAIHSTLKA